MNILVIDGKAVPVYTSDDRRELIMVVGSALPIIKDLLCAEQDRYRVASERNRAQHQESMVEYDSKVAEWNTKPLLTRAWISSGAAHWAAVVFGRHWPLRPTVPTYYWSNTDRIFYLMKLISFMQVIQEAHVETEYFPAGFIVSDPEHYVGAILHEVQRWREQR